MTRIARLPGVRLSPKVLLARVLENADDLESVVIIETPKKGVVAACWSAQELRDTAYAIQVLRRQFDRALGDEDSTVESVG
ncbi:MAG: hypothetical protein ACE5HV_00140 [Acidobacteriota bacterium]